MTETIQDNAQPTRPTATPRDQRRQTPLWRITGTFTLLTPLHIGTGRDAPITLAEGLFNPDEPLPDTARHVATVVRDHAQRPCIPGSSFKGALHELARRAGMDKLLRQKLFGAELARDETQAAAVEFTYLYAQPGSVPAHSGLPLFDQAGHPHVAHLPHVSRNRNTGAAESKRLFLSQVLPPGVPFAFECTARGLSDEEVSALLGLLVLAGHPDSGIRLGAGKAADQGRVQWHPGETRKLDTLGKVWAALNAPGQKTPASAITPGALWSGTALSQRQKLEATPLTHPDAQWLTLSGLELKFHSPFLIYQRRKKQEGSGEADGAPRTDHHGHAVLPATSLHGALRAQAERILRTIGRETPAGYEVPGVYGLDCAATLDLASVLFGAAGWRSLLRCSDFTDNGQSQDITHHMVAIDRLTGGGKDSAKFSIRVRDCPTLTGSLAVDMGRLGRLEAKTPGVTKLVLGLLAHVLRDLDEGDIPLGYGASKGYGQQRSATLKKLTESKAQWPGLAACWSTFADFSETTRPASSTVLRKDPTLVPEQGSPHISTPTSTTSDQTFHNPYVFIPFGTPRPEDALLPWVHRTALNSGHGSHHSHARYAGNGFHGRIVCTATATTPIFVGAGDKFGKTANNTDSRDNPPTNTSPREQSNYKLKNNYALPATSLRGMLSSLHEAITASRLRVAADRRYSVRYVTEMNGDQLSATLRRPNPSAIGRLIEFEGNFWIQMLALPTLRLTRSGAILDEPGYQALARPGKRAPLKSLFGDRTIPEQELMQFLPEKGKKFRTAKMPCPVNATVQIRHDNKLFIALDNIDALHTSKGYVFGIRRDTDERPVDLRTTLNSQNVERGLVRVMQSESRHFVEKDEDAFRKYEVFLPFDLEQQQTVEDTKKLFAQARAQGTLLTMEKIQKKMAECHLLPVPQGCLDQFCRLADEMTAQQDNKTDQDLPFMMWRPFHPNGTSRNGGNIDKVFFDIKTKNRRRVLRPQNNDLVYFRPNTQGDAIEEISYSSMWRREITLSTTELVGGQAGDILPNGTQQVERLSPSELLFGTVEVRSEESARCEPVAAWMSKVRFSAGVSADPIQPGPLQNLKILSSPKPPCPSMYFKLREQTEGAYISKANLWAEPKKYQLKGRKIYLHAHQKFEIKPNQNPQRKILPLNDHGYHGGQRLPWQTIPDPQADPSLNKQKISVQPLPAGSRFYFSIDFHNLSQSELESLCACLRPHGNFEHKIGMGKPIGLGSIKIEMIGLHLIDRQCRYSQRELQVDSRYQAQWIQGKHELPNHLKQEKTVMISTPTATSPQHLARSFMARLQEQEGAVHQALVLSGDPRKVTCPVHYPQLQNRSIEKETFAWFVNNDKPSKTWTGKQQHLQDFQNDSVSLPTLHRVERRKIQKTK